MNSLLFRTASLRLAHDAVPSHSAEASRRLAVRETISGIPEGSGNFCGRADNTQCVQKLGGGSCTFPENFEKKVGAELSRYFSVCLTGPVSRSPRRT
jgi:hypothetical protein